MKPKNDYENRRDFLKKTGLIGLGIAGSGILGCTGEEEQKPRSQTFNMSGYTAPKLDAVRVAIIGLGNRGSGTVMRLATIEGVEIKALCDLEPDRVQKSAENISHLGHKPNLYSGDENNWKKICERADIDLIAIVTPWHLHTPMCVYAMEHEKHAYTELPAALTMEECWQLVETSERTRKHCVQMSSNCHGGIAATILNMVREGFFGELIHGEGCYIHDLLLDYNFSKTMYHNMWRIKQNIGRHGSLYPQHGLVPIMQMMDINYGDKMKFLVSVSSDDFLMNKTAERLSEKDDFWSDYVDKDFRGNMNVTVIKTVKGRTMVIQHDVSSPRPRGGRMLSGTEAFWQSHPDRIATRETYEGWGHYGWLPEEEFQTLVDKYSPGVNRKFRELTAQARQIDRGGHSYYQVSPTDWRLIDCLRNGLPMDIDIYDAAASSSIIPLSIQSVANHSNAVEIPDFTCGSWKTNQRGMDINFQKGGGNTKLL